MPVTKDFVLTAIIDRKNQYDGNAVVCVSHGPGIVEKAGVLTPNSKYPFINWIPLDEMDPSNFH